MQRCNAVPTGALPIPMATLWTPSLFVKRIAYSRGPDDIPRIDGERVFCPAPMASILSVWKPLCRNAQGLHPPGIVTV